MWKFRVHVFNGGKVHGSILANRRMRTAACLDAHITRSVHAIEGSVVRDRISRSVSYSIRKLVQRESVRLPERQYESCSGCRDDRIVEWRLDAKTCDHAYRK